MKYCPKCGAATRPNQKFCGSCGAPLSSTPPQAQASWPPVQARRRKIRNIVVAVVRAVCLPGGFCGGRRVLFFPPGGTPPPPGERAGGGGGGGGGREGGGVPRRSRRARAPDTAGITEAVMAAMREVGRL